MNSVALLNSNEIKISAWISSRQITDVDALKDTYSVDVADRNEFETIYSISTVVDAEQKIESAAATMGAAIQNLAKSRTYGGVKYSDDEKVFVVLWDA